MSARRGDVRAVSAAYEHTTPKVPPRPAPPALALVLPRLFTSPPAGGISTSIPTMDLNCVYDNNNNTAYCILDAGRRAEEPMKITIYVEQFGSGGQSLASNPRISQGKRLPRNHPACALPHCASREFEHFVDVRVYLCTRGARLSEERHRPTPRRVCGAETRRRCERTCARAGRDNLTGGSRRAARQING
ncbi:hypothetical protein EYF80_041750 [Liparis tanakae]|uniref:Uncharacterized protein n=1 Tax=Liparis tanakae TaxID=230148 RepID=A0A4Z2G4N3_9TELE|nr:hypothetical protein EYF80_041750 [Liparis tanakae]